MKPICSARRGSIILGSAVLILGLLPVLLGCAALPTDVAPPATRPSITPLAATSTPARAAETKPDRLISRWADSPPEVDGLMDEVWSSAEPLRLPLTWGMEGTAHALDVEIRSLHTDQDVYLFARWPDEAPHGDENVVSNVLTVHWRIPDPAARRLDCTVACHTAFAGGDGRLAYANAETIPQGGGEALNAAGGWAAGAWTFEWSRPLINDNPYDLQFEDLELEYSFLVKVFERTEGRPDPISERHWLVFHP